MPGRDHICVCQRVNNGRPHAVSRAEWYKHLQAAETEQERDTIRAGNISVDLQTRIQAHVNGQAVSTSRPMPPSNPTSSDISVAHSNPGNPQLLEARRKHLRADSSNSSSADEGGADKLGAAGAMAIDQQNVDEEDRGGDAGDMDFAGQNNEQDNLPDDEPRQRHQDDAPAGHGVELGAQIERAFVDLDELADLAVLPHMKTTMEFIRALRSASLDDRVAKLDEDVKQNLRNPPRIPPNIVDPIIRHAIRTYFALEHSAQSVYERIRASTTITYPDAEAMPSFRRIERIIGEFTGVESITHDMCPDTCLAFTGPFGDLEKCPICDKDRYDQIKLQASAGRNKVARQFHTIPIGPQIQALWRDADSAKQMYYRHERTERLLQEIREAGGTIDTYDDFIMGSDYLHAVVNGDISENDVVLMISMDGVQLYESKVSDCWIYHLFMAG